MKESILRLNEELKRVIMHSLKRYKQTLATTLNKNALQTEIANHEIRIVQQAVVKLQESKSFNSSLPTIASHLKRQTSDEMDWEHIFSKMKSGEVGAVCVIGKTGDNIQVSYEGEDQSFILMLNGHLIMQNQDLGIIMRQFQKMYIKQM